ncbi:hypothetical protein D910_04708 [Dendroctonus ponderosae]|uniref:Protein Wnt n=1 Tax=Dendroctonus ponderosae TaxID=77166 RepID=U4U4P1_DENPD|nr:hypothetical protein D910_04708 [Dendroctonus ponderosae]
MFAPIALNNGYTGKIASALAPELEHQFHEQQPWAWNPFGSKIPMHPSQTKIRSGQDPGEIVPHLDGNHAAYPERCHAGLGHLQKGIQRAPMELFFDYYGPISHSGPDQSNPRCTYVITIYLLNTPSKQQHTDRTEQFFRPFRNNIQGDSTYCVAATREQAYVYAISSAALTYTLARACSSGNLHHCTCAGRPTSPNVDSFQWGGCGDNVRWASQFAKRFIDNVEKHSLGKKEKTKRAKEDNSILRDDAAVVNLHNNRVGRKVIMTSLRTQCKCHGVSGSCNIKTCWKALPSMTEVGQQLLQKYTTAKEVSKTLVDRLQVQVGKKVATSEQLVYMSKSPDYCTKDEKLGSFGTVGRHCNVSSNSLDSCRILCCGRGYRTVVEEKIERCQCKFYNCCYVKCKICRTMSQVYECL